MKQYNYITTVFVFALFLFAGCGNSSEPDMPATGDSDQLIKITQKQLESEKIEMGEMTPHIFERRVTCNGYIKAPVNGIARINTPVSGIVENINCALGDFVKKGELLFLLSSNDLMIIQQEFSETSTILNRLKADYERSKRLFDEKIGAEKDFLAIESEYRAMQAKYTGLKIRLESLKLNVTKIEKGDLYSTYPVVAPIRGYITSLDLVLGQFAEQQKDLIEIVDVNKLQLQLSVFEDDVSKLQTGQMIEFNLLGDSLPGHSAKLTSIGRAVTQESRSIRCIADILNVKGVPFINNSYIEASVIIDQDEAQALPNEAILKSDDEHFVFIVEKSDYEYYYLRREKVTIGRAYGGYSEIINGELSGKVLVKGVYNLQ